jgi:hypothetical protein
MGAPTPDAARSRLREQLISARIAGAVATPREANLRSYRNFASERTYHRFGLTSSRPWTAEEVLEVMVRRCGVDPDPDHQFGADTIDPDLTLAALDAAAQLLAQTAAAGGSVLLATGHPAGLLEVHLGLAAGLRAAGCPLRRAAAGWRYSEMHGGDEEFREIRWVNDVAVVSDRGQLNHTHSARPMQAVLAELAESGQAPPDLVVADHGWAGAAAEGGLPVVGFADCNDPALFIGQEEGKVAVVVPLDDNVAPHLYLPAVQYLRRAALL